jgi:hypothetical protein
MSTKIIGLPRWDHPDAYYSQINNAIEAKLKKSGVNDWLESCGPTSAVCILDALGADVQIMTPGAWLPQPEDILTLWFNDPRNYPAMRIRRPDVDPATIMGNRVPQWYELAIPAVFGVKARFYWGASKVEITMALQNGRGVMACLKKPGHYIAIVAEDITTGEFIYHDTWPGNQWPASMTGKPGRCRRVSYSELASNVQGFRVEIGQ